MQVLDVDPEYSTGMAYLNEDGELVSSFLATDAAQVLERVQKHEGLVVIEDFVGAGPRTKEAIFVLKLIGGVTATCYLENKECVIQVPQQRIPLIYEAKSRVEAGT